jgi:septal ring factor EnvC (AmiA/AmiB activator)
MIDKNKTVETSLVKKTEALRDELKNEIDQMKSRLAVVEEDVKESTAERNKLTAKIRQLEPMLARVESDLSRLLPDETVEKMFYYKAKITNEEPTAQKSKILETEVKTDVKGKGKKTEVKNDQ